MSDYSASRKSLKQKMDAANTKSEVISMRCSFMCGRNSSDPALEPNQKGPHAQLIKWGKADDRLPNGSPYGATYDNYCYRTWFGCYRFRYPERASFVKKLGEDKTLLDDFIGDTNKLIDKRNGQGDFDMAARRAEVAEINQRERKFIKPKCKFWPMKLYRKELKQNTWSVKEKKSHVKHEEDGVLGFL